LKNEEFSAHFPLDSQESAANHSGSVRFRFDARPTIRRTTQRTKALFEIH
jgi:hypothetical protein